MSTIEGMECVNCRKTLPYDTEKIQYLCPSCGGNLQVVYDYKKIGRSFSRETLKKNGDYSIWRYEPLLPVRDRSLAPPLSIGWTPLYHAKALGDELGGLRNLHIKDEGRNPSASFKDRAGAIALVCARERGISLITGASTGNAGSSMACLCASVGISPYIFVPEKAPRAKIAQLLLFGAHVLLVRGTYDEAFDLCLKVSEHFGWFNRNTGYNPFTREGKKTCSLEICEQLHWEAPDWIFVSVGDGNIISGIWKGLCDLRDLGFIDKVPKLCGVQSTLSNAIAKAVRESPADPVVVKPVQATTVADSISVDMPRDGIAAVRAIRESGGMAVEVSDEEILAAIRITAARAGVFGEPAGVACIAGLRKLAAQNIIAPDDRIVCVVTGNGLKDVDSALKVAGTAVTIDADLRAVENLIKCNQENK